MEANSQIVIDDGPVIMEVEGEGEATPVTITGNGVVNTSFKSTDLQIVYKGTGEIKLAGGDQTAAVVYAPNAIHPSQAARISMARSSSTN